MAPSQGLSSHQTRSRIISAYSSLASDLDPDYLRDHLIKSCNIPFQQWEEIQNKNFTRQKRCRGLMSLLMRMTRPRIWIAFWKILTQNQEWEWIERNINQRTPTTSFDYQAKTRRTLMTKIKSRRPCDDHGNNITRTTKVTEIEWKKNQSSCAFQMHFHANSFAIWTTRVLLLMICFIFRCTGEIVRAPVDTEVLLNGSTFFNCSTSNPSATINWYHYPVGMSSSGRKYVYAYGQMYSPYDHRFRIEKDNMTSSLNLVISGVERDDAGLYVCQNGKDTGFTAELIVIDPIPACDSNIQNVGFIGPNSCGLQQDSIQLSCSIKYFGNASPKLSWIQIFENNISIYLPDGVTNCRNMPAAILCNMTIQVNAAMDGSQLVCQSNRSRNVQYYKSDSIGVKYAFSKETQVEEQIDAEVVCSFETNSEFCHYTWVWIDGKNEQVVSNKTEMKVSLPGRYRCEAFCQLKDASCKFNGTLIQVVNKDGQRTHLIAIITAVIISITITFAILVLICLHKKGLLFERRKKQKWKRPPSEADIDPREGDFVFRPTVVGEMDRLKK